MLELNRSYEARFLGRQVLTSAVTSDVLCHLVHELPETIHGGIRCTVLCSGSGLIVTRSGNSGAVSALGEENGVSGNTILRVPLTDILFCHVDKTRPEVTVWVVRSKESSEDAAAHQRLNALHHLPVFPVNRIPTVAQAKNQANSNSKSGGGTLNAYIYNCLNPSDAVGLFKVYNEMNRQAKLEKYRGRNAQVLEKRTTTAKTSEPPRAVSPSGHTPSQAVSEVLASKDISDSDDSHASISSKSSSLGSTADTTSPPPFVTVISTSSILPGGPQTRSHRYKGQPSVKSSADSGPTRNDASSIPSDHQDGGNSSKPPITWTSIAGSIENYRRSFHVLRPKDREVRAAMLEELREKLRTRYIDDDNDRLEMSGTSRVPEAVSKKPLAPPAHPFSESTARSSSRQLATNRQRKPAKIITETGVTNETTTSTESMTELSEKPAVIPPSLTKYILNSDSGIQHSSASTKTSNGLTLPFPWSMSNMVKKLILKKNFKAGADGGGGGEGAKTVAWMLPVRIGSQTSSTSAIVPIANHVPTRKFKTKKGPAPLPPSLSLQGPSIPPRIIANGMDQFFYLPPIPNEASTGNGGRNAGVDASVFVPVLPPAWVRNRAGSKHGGQPFRESDMAMNGHNMKKDNLHLRSGNSTNENGVLGHHHSSGGHHPLKKKGHQHGVAYYGGISGIHRSAIRGHHHHHHHSKKRIGAPNYVGSFIRYSSTGSRGSSSSDSGPEGKLRSVMKKPRQTNGGDHPHNPILPEQKKNVTFHAYATVQVLP